MAGENEKSNKSFRTVSSLAVREHGFFRGIQQPAWYRTRKPMSIVSLLSDKTQVVKGDDTLIT